MPPGEYRVYISVIDPVIKISLSVGHVNDAVILLKLYIIIGMKHINSFHISLLIISIHILPL